MRESRKNKLVIALLAALAVALNAGAQRRISIFYDHIAEIARQEKIETREAAQRIRQLGYEGVDVRVTMSDEELAMLDELGFKHASAIADIDFNKADLKEVTRRVLDFMHHHDYTRLLLVPSLLPQDATPEHAEAVCGRIAAFAKKAHSEGIVAMVEDFDNPRSPCYNTAALDHLMAAAPSLNHVFDTGNYPYCGEDVMVALRHFRERVQHVHLKDRKAQRDSASLPIGTGIVPLKEFVAELLRSGYDGWFTVEHFGARNMLEYATRSIANVKTAWDEAGKGQ